MEASEKLVAYIKSVEGFRPHAYRDSAGVWTIGYGHTSDVGPNDSITPWQAELELRAELAKWGAHLETMLHVSVSQCQFDALLDLSYNIGLQALGSSTLLKKLNSGDYKGAANQFMAWTKSHVNGHLVDLPGLIERRAKEKEWFCSDLPADRLDPGLVSSNGPNNSPGNA